MADILTDLFAKFDQLGERFSFSSIRDGLADLLWRETTTTSVADMRDAYGSAPAANDVTPTGSVFGASGAEPSRDVTELVSPNSYPTLALDRDFDRPNGAFPDMQSLPGFASQAQGIGATS